MRLFFVHMTTLLRWLGVVLLLSVAAEAVAQERPRVYVVDFSGYREQVKPLLREQITDAVRERLAADPTVTLTAPLNRAGGGMNPAIIEGIKLFDAGRGMLVDQRPAEAAASFQAALEHFENNVASVVDWRMVETLLFRLSTARWLADDVEGSQQIMRRLLTYNQAFEAPEEDDIPPAYYERLAELKRAQGRLDAGAVATAGVEPAGAEVWIDGKVRGVTPMQIDNVTPGTHFVALRKDDQALGGALVTVEPGEVATVSATITQGGSPEEALDAVLSGGLVNDSVRLALRDAANRSATPVVVTALVVPGRRDLQVVAFVYDLEAGTLRQLNAQPFDRDLLNVNVNGYQLASAIIRAIHQPDRGALITSPVTLSPDDFASQGVDTGTGAGAGAGAGTGTGTGDGAIIGIQDGIDGDDAWYESPWLWTGVGVGVAAAVIATVLLTSGDDGGAGPAPGFGASISWR